MAQPLFDDHPLEEYFRQTGEFAEPMPGGSSDFVLESEDPIDLSDTAPQLDIKLPQYVVQVVQLLHDLLQSSSNSSQEANFAERFKYDVISSSLLANSLAAPPTSAVRRTFSPDIPGKLDDRGRSRKDDDPPSVETKTDSPYPPNPDPNSNAESLGPQVPYALVSVAVLALSGGYHFFALVLFSAAAYVKYVVHSDSEKSDTTKQTLDALNELISSGNVWDSAVNEAMMLIENEERRQVPPGFAMIIFYGPTSSQAPSSALRLALQSSLQTTQLQCDNVRQLLSALTSPTSLSQLAEMYAPPSPVRPPISLLDSPRSPVASSGMRPFSLPMTTPFRHRTTSTPGTSPANKRATWNGSYAALALAGSPTAHMLKRKQMNRRSDLASLFPPQQRLSSVSAPVSPQPPSPAPKAGLEDVAEEEDQAADELEVTGYFGAAALDLQRKRRSAAFEVFGIPPPSYASSAEPSPVEPPLRSPTRPSHSRASSGISPTPTISSSSRLTSVHTTRHPLSLSGLHLALQGAIAAKRYTCSHLLALRFNEDEDETYWENVRSVMALLTSAFADASARLVEALDEAEKRRIKDEHPTPPCGPSQIGRDSSISPIRSDKIRMRSMAEMVSFAPMPSSMSRFGAHVDSIANALNDARDHLEECVAALRDTASRRQSLEVPEGGVPSVQDHPAFQAYDRLRKELGFALRECERGRERLLDIIAGPRPAPEGAEDEEEASPQTPGLRHDSGSDSSEKGPASPNVQLDARHGEAGLGLELNGHDSTELDDATAHLLLTASSQHLPPPGAEQVYEAETGNGAVFTRERSKLSREERIKLAKARRASGIPLSSSSYASSDVAEGAGSAELKDVIWKVGEKRRKLSQRLSLPPPPKREHEDVQAEGSALTSEPTPIPAPIPVPVDLRQSSSEEAEESEPESESESDVGALGESKTPREQLRRVPIDTLRTELEAAVAAVLMHSADVDGDDGSESDMS
ncbi:hypothetical protein ONZ51_g8426 [Trametes cubensis]|uniref:Myosin-binding domain-containing protein n=1 Tax=Trametes cubensis TaxID=1111947 RepID=A0AAD7TNB7_9APHY|nr:hypothetical protein ONZ51_g8426 [Trametes cubensis]